MDQLDTSLAIETPEHISFRHLLAGPARRIAAYSVDLMLRAFLAGIVAVVIMVTFAGGFQRLAGAETGLLLLALFVLEWGYFLAFDLLWAGQSPGKRAFQLRVIHQSGRPLSAGDSVLRNLLRAADFLPISYALGLLTMVSDVKFRRLGDLVAGTVVIHEPRQRPIAFRPSDAVTEAIDLPARPSLSSKERAALALFNRRAGSLTQARAEELAEIVAPIFRQRFALPNAPALALVRQLAQKAGS